MGQRTNAVRRDLFLYPHLKKKNCCFKCYIIIREDLIDPIHHFILEYFPSFVFTVFVIKKPEDHRDFFILLILFKFWIL